MEVSITEKINILLTKEYSCDGIMPGCLQV